MKRLIFQGACTALVTPFSENGVDIAALDRLVDRQLSGSIDALLACGTTGEPSTLSDKEWEQVVSRVVERVNGRVPVLAGTGGNNTSEVIRKAGYAKALGAEAQLCVTPYYNKTTQRGLIAHYTAIADNSVLPIIIYNVPSRTGLNMLPETLKMLCAHENIIAIKEASTSVAQTGEIRRLCGDDISVYSGCDELTIPLMSIGAKGVISVASNIIPGYMHEMTEAYRLCDTKKAADMQCRLLGLIKALFCEMSPGPIKAAMQMLGQCKATVRLPLVEMESENAKNLEKELKEMGLLQI